jgi:ketosteroid isomerase-like protein
VSENLDLVRSIWAAWGRGDYSSTEWAHPEIEFMIADGVEPGSWTGLAGMAAAWRRRLSAWEWAHTKAEEFRALDDERVLVLYSAKGRGKTSGLELGELRARGACVFYVRGDQVTRLLVYNVADRALADLGLKE